MRYAQPQSEISEINQALEILQKYHVTDEELAQIFEILSDLFKEKGIYIDSADFSIESNGKEKWIHYQYALSVSSEELSALEAELNIRLSELPSKIFDAVEIDIVSSEPITDKPKDMSEIILANNGLMESIKIAQAETKISNLLESPMGFGEPLKDDLRGFSSCPVKKSFIIVYVYCRECRLKGYQSIRNCIRCNEIEDETVIFSAFGPHDTAYKEAKKRNLSDETFGK